MPTIRPAVPTDVPAVLGLVRDLAVYEREPDAVEMSPEQLHDALFGPDPTVSVHVADRDGHLVGFALWFRTFSTWTGTHGIHLEDLFVVPSARGHGVGRALLAHLAAICDQQGWVRLEWAVLDWNQPAIEFYDRLGAVQMSDWITCRLTGDALTALARDPVRSSGRSSGRHDRTMPAP